MRIDVKKLLFIGLEKERSSFFEEAQKLGIIHFIPPKKGQSKETPTDAAKIGDAIKILNSIPSVEQEVSCDYSAVDRIVSEILLLYTKEQQLLEEEKNLQFEIAKVAPFGDYSPEEIAWIEEKGERSFQFFCAKQEVASSGTLPEELIYISTEGTLDYFLAITREKKTFDKIDEIAPKGPLGALQSSLHEIECKRHACQAELKSYGKYNRYLHHALIDKCNSHSLSLANACAEGQLEGKLFAVQGWVAEGKMQALKELAKRLHLHVEEVAIEPNDSVPTCLENQGAGRLGEDLVTIYDTPSTQDKDPSLWVLFFFALFFSMIIGDGGYGIILLIGALYAKMHYAKISEKGNRLVNLTLILAASCMVWGLLTTSLFGISFSPDSPVRKLSLLTWLAEKKTHYHFSRQDEIAEEWFQEMPALRDIEDPKQILLAATSSDPISNAPSYDLLNDFSNDILLELALFIGAIHISLSMLRTIRKNPSGIGWILFIVGCYLYFPEFLGATSLVHFAFGIDKVRGAEMGTLLIGGGIAIALLIGVVKDKLFGLLECMNILQIFGDIMSYLRLYALGLSGALVVSTTNELASTLPLFFAGFLLLFAHGINLVLCIMGGVIHGLRLNFLEWYHYSFEGGGKEFSPLKKIEIE